MSILHIQNKSDKETIQLLGLDGINVFATLAPGNFVEIKTTENAPLKPFIVKQLEQQRQ